MASTLALALGSALERLNERAAGFTWPEQGIPFSTSRYATVPEQSATALSATATSRDKSGAWVQTDKLSSTGFRGTDTASLAAGTYTLRLSQGDGVASPDTRDLSLTLTGVETNDQVLRAVASAVNNATLPVRAEVTSQTGVGTLDPLSVKTGSVLTLAVDDAGAGQSIGLSDVSGHLASWLGLTDRDLTALSPTDAAQTGLHHVSVASVARPTTYVSKGFDPEAETTLSPGSYTIGYAMGPSSGNVYEGQASITVTAGETWRQVLTAMANTLGSASPAMAAQLVPAKRVWDSTTDDSHAVVDALGMSVTAVDPKTGWRLRLSDGSADTGTGNILSAMGLNVLAEPGSDATRTIDGRTSTTASNTVTADRGRLSFTATSTFSEDVPVSVSGPFERLADSLTDVVNAYNGLRDLLTGNAEVLKDGLAEDWRTPVSNRAGSLSGIGLAETGRDKLLWLASDTFLTALTTNPEQVRDILLGQGGLLPALAEKSDKTLSAGAESMLRTEQSYPERNPMLRTPTTRSEIEVEKASQLLDLYDTVTPEPLGGKGWSATGGLLRRRG